MNDSWNLVCGECRMTNASDLLTQSLWFETRHRDDVGLENRATQSILHANYDDIRDSLDAKNESFDFFGVNLRTSYVDDSVAPSRKIHSIAPDFDKITRR